MSQPQFSCGACGKVYAWKPQLAGKKGTCKCGNVFQVPAEPEAPAAAAPTCPSCGAELGEGAVLCINCGYNLKTGAAVQTQVETEAPVAAAAVAPGRMAAAPQAPRKPGGAFVPPQRGREEPQTGSHQKQVILGGVLLVVIIGVIVGAKLYFKKSSAPEGPMLGRDAEATEMLKTQGPKEANEFLDSGPNTMLGNEWTRPVAKIRVKGWYDMGAKKVWAFGARMSASVVIELPDDPEGRKKLFDWVRQWDKDRNPGRTPQTDVGQRYLIIALIGGGLG